MAQKPTSFNFITGNANKVAEVKVMLQGYLDVRPEAPELPEVQGTIEVVSTAKCKQAVDQVQGPVLVEDTCLIFNALSEKRPDGSEGIQLPGPYIKWFLKSMGVEGLPKLLADFEDKSAQAVCTFAYAAGPGQVPTLFEGRTSVSDTRRAVECIDDETGIYCEPKRAHEFWYVTIGNV